MADRILTVVARFEQDGMRFSEGEVALHGEADTGSGWEGVVAQPAALGGLFGLGETFTDARRSLAVTVWAAVRSGLTVEDGVRPEDIDAVRLVGITGSTHPVARSVGAIVIPAVAARYVHSGGSVWKADLAMNAGPFAGLAGRGTNLDQARADLAYKVRERVFGGALAPAVPVGAAVDVILATGTPKTFPITMLQEGLAS